MARSHPVATPEGINAIDMHRITWPQMGPFIRREVGAMLAAVVAESAGASLVLQDGVVPYRIGDQTGQRLLLAA